MRKNSKQKGSRGERAAVKLLRGLGYDARRSQQYKGTADSADIEHNIFGVHLEVKFGYPNATIGSKAVEEFLAQAEKEKRIEDTALVLYKPDRKPWQAIFRHGEMIVHTADVKNAIKWCSDQTRIRLEIE